VDRVGVEGVRLGDSTPPPPADQSAAADLYEQLIEAIGSLTIAEQLAAAAALQARRPRFSQLPANQRAAFVRLEAMLSDADDGD
jgi:hypothetical protein